MGRIEEIQKERQKKVNELRKEGVNPYPSGYNKEDYVKDLQEKFKKLNDGARTKSKVNMAGRVMAIRDMGKLIFAEVQDGSGKIQIALQDGDTSNKEMKFFKKFIDAGDFIGVKGVIMKTKRGELSILVDKVELLTKSILPLPEKWHGLKDEEEKYRKRYLDILLNPELKEMFRKKAIFWNTIRGFLIEEGFTEVETPVLENKTGGADAAPFVTHHNALDIDVYLRISMGELWQKRLMVAGFEKTFEIGRQFRNEGMSHEHLQDYSQMEFYWAYADFNKAMDLVEEMYKRVTGAVLGSYKFESRGYKVDLNKKWKRIKYAEEIKKQTGIDIFKVDEERLKKELRKRKVEIEESWGKERLIDYVWKECRKNITGPCFIINPPVEICPLAKKNSRDPRVADRFWVLIAGSELGNGYSELNDPIDQEQRFIKQQEMRDKGDEEAQMHDKDFVEALKYGMPPTAGFGLSERVFAYLVGKPAREAQIFPLLKPEEEKSKSSK
ncbi:MAG: lysine--tRNA ligase [archaeon]